jgi:hypothetical protein
MFSARRRVYANCLSACAASAGTRVTNKNSLIIIYHNDNKKNNSNDDDR